MMFPQLLTRASRIHSGFHGDSSGGGLGSVGGAAIAVILIVMFIIFGCSYIYLYRKAKREFLETKKPISHLKIFLTSLLISSVVGLVILFCTSLCSDNDSDNNGSQDVEAQQSVPMAYMGAAPAYNPVPQTMDWAPIQSAAQAPIQG